MNFGTLVVGLLLVLMVIGVIRSLVKKKKEGKCSCGCDCGTCGGCSGVSSASPKK